MKQSFAALRFIEDANIADNVYWYLCEFPIKAGERVLAPVGAHNRLQCARVERTLTAEENGAPYDVRLIKKVAAKYGVCERNFGGYTCRDLGGRRYDAKRYTRFGEVYYCEEVPSEEQLSALHALGIAVLHTREDALSAVARANAPVLICGAGAADTAKKLFALVCGAEDAGLTPEEITLLKNKLI
ncbi:MAG: hypothetical protein K2G44_01730 [Clostridia bacterium]|nr:hypothetical protein [Clostridia bacterium]